MLTMIKRDITLIMAIVLLLTQTNDAFRLNGRFGDLSARQFVAQRTLGVLLVLSPMTANAATITGTVSLAIGSKVVTSDDTALYLTAR